MAMGARQLCWLREHRPDAIPPSVMSRLTDDGTLRPEEAASSSAQPTPSTSWLLKMRSSSPLLTWVSVQAPTELTAVISGVAAPAMSA